MRERKVIFAPEARDGLLSLYDSIAFKANPVTALSYIQRLEKYCLGFAFASERGHLREDRRRALAEIGNTRSSFREILSRIATALVDTDGSHEKSSVIVTHV
ncbi:MAG: type II toxin-antitoxin system RelE/ParE family toxin [Alphaproteobacteria bacterium]